jgi:hypothetical protein
MTAAALNVGTLISISHRRRKILRGGDPLLNALS